ncbi:MAG: SycD/LcrH family type III secretion system chaperone [Succinivibrio sp.]|nr:SycD/LcrH family type III secretion system chaperone [Succinivibrio sp.]
MATTELAVELPLEDKEIIDLVANGVSVAQMVGLSDEKLELLYALAYTQYQAGNYSDSENIFRVLCLYDGTQERFWMGLAGSLQHEERFAEAAEIYSMACTMTGLTDPEPMYYAARCLLKDGRSDDAINALDFIDIMGREGNAKDLEIKKNAKALIETLRSTKNENKS